MPTFEEPASSSRRLSVDNGEGDLTSQEVMRTRAITQALATGRLSGTFDKLNEGGSGTKTVPVTWRMQEWFIEESTEAKDSFEGWLVRDDKSTRMMVLQKGFSLLCLQCIPRDVSIWASQHRVLAFALIASSAYLVRLLRCTPATTAACALPLPAHLSRSGTAAAAAPAHTARWRCCSLTARARVHGRR